ncbi:MAG: hypothetical protein DMG17_27540 [Acidobacteria bacterium]|nr:MAG: hypothetical protein DMG17_27540 [Acidobacteriota bacterium]
MCRRRWCLIYAFPVLVTLFTVSCSQPAGNASAAKTSQAAPAETSTKGDVEAAPVERPKPVEQVKKRPAEPVRVAAAPRPSAPAPSPAPVGVTPAPPAPAPDTPQQSVANPPAPAPIFVPAPQSDPIPVPVPPSPEPATKQVTIPAGTDVYIRMIDSIDTEQAHPNETFRASLDKPIVVDGQTIIPARSDVFVKVVEVQSAGKLSGTSELKVELDKLFIGKQSYPVVSNTFTETGSSEGKKAARNVGIGAAVGGIIGGILGGKKGAIIGAGAGGGGGAVITKPDQIRINSETQLLFKLENPVEVTAVHLVAPITEWARIVLRFLSTLHVAISSSPPPVPISVYANNVNSLRVRMVPQNWRRFRTGLLPTPRLPPITTLPESGRSPRTDRNI